MPDDVQEIKITLAVLVSEQKNIAHDLKNMSMAMQSLVTRREIEEYQKHRAETHDTLKERVSTLERDKQRVFWALVGSYIAGLGVVFQVFVRGG